MVARSFPLQWPDGWGRTETSNRRRSHYKVAPDKAAKELVRSLELLGARAGSIVVSSNVQSRADGLPYADRRTPDDPGVAVYWTSLVVDERNMATPVERVMACDRWLLLHENIRAIGLAVDGLRSIERAGASQIFHRAFSAFGALPSASGAARIRPWWEVFELAESAIGALDVAMVDARYRTLAAKAHPDRGGSAEAMAEINRARADAHAHYGKAAT